METTEQRTVRKSTSETSKSEPKLVCSLSAHEHCAEPEQCNCMCEICVTARTCLTCKGVPNTWHRFGCPNQGVKFDKDKTRFDLLPSRSLLEVAEVLTHGAAKYGDENWRQVLKERGEQIYKAALQRHFHAWNLGETNDQESNLHHLAHLICCAIFLMEAELNARAMEEASDD